jgi:hypothetical protein
MAYDEHLAERMRQVLRQKQVPFEEKRMMGGLVFMVDDKMCAGIVKNDMMGRIDPGIFDFALTRKGCRKMDFTGASMAGFVLIDPEGVDLDADLEYWIGLCLEFNPKAKSSKKK